ncbi:VOC family protein [Kribbella sp. NPDC056345]|uniref:VOC family protein n=1 Tax=Kribbella sp. NPDC056345 TaxID=3345789 RepID=UPI0035D532A3
MPAELLDHLVLGTADLLGTVRRFADATGVDPVEGGRHERWGTRNFLVGLGGTAYLELLGPDVDATREPAFDFGAERFLTWAIHPADIDAVLATARAAGTDLGTIGPLSRKTPNGELLSWRVSTPPEYLYDGLVPFLIDWGTTPHPTTTLPTVDLVSLHATHPQADELRAVLQLLSTSLDLSTGPAALTATFRGPRGEYTVS